MIEQQQKKLRGKKQLYKFQKGKLQDQPNGKSSLLLRAQWRIVAVSQSLVPPVAGPHWVFPRDGIFVVVVLVIKFNTFVLEVHPLNHLTKGSKSQQIERFCCWKLYSVIVRTVFSVEEKPSFAINLFSFLVVHICSSRSLNLCKS